MNSSDSLTSICTQLYRATILQIALLTVWICGLMVFPVSDDSYITRRSRNDDDDDIKQL